MKHQDKHNMKLNKSVDWAEEENDQNSLRQITKFRMMVRLSHKSVPNFQMSKAENDRLLYSLYYLLKEYTCTS